MASTPPARQAAASGDVVRHVEATRAAVQQRGGEQARRLVSLFE